MDSPTEYRTLMVEGARVTLDPALDGWVAVDLADQPWVFFLLMEDVGGVPEITGLRMVRRTASNWAVATAEGVNPVPVPSPAEAIVSTDRLRGIPLGFLGRAAAAILSPDVEGVRRAITDFRSTRAPGAALDLDHYREVARVYTEALRWRRSPPLKAVMEHFGVKRAMASRYVKRARDEGFLGWPDRPGVPGITAAKSPMPKGHQR